MKNCELDPYFSPILSHLYDYTKAIEKYELTRLQAALLFAMQIKEIDNILIGVTSSQQLQEIIKAYEELSDKKIDFSFATLQDERFINPIMWKLSEC
ncbi:MAG: Aldo/keto reductase [uncultured bacterium]|nr:MAG: Aldo/keto reductase [uncultured bacterium]